MNIPEDVLEAGLKVFADEESLSTWLSTPARWDAQHRTPAEIIAAGGVRAVLEALRGLAEGIFL